MEQFGDDGEYLRYTLPRHPTFLDTPVCVPMGITGVQHNGIFYFNPLTLEGLNAVTGAAGKYRITSIVGQHNITVFCCPFAHTLYYRPLPNFVKSQILFAFFI